MYNWITIKVMKVITVSNIKGGTGKSTISANLITAMSNHGYKVLAIDTDKPQYTLTNYFKNRDSESKNTFEHIKLDDIDNLSDVIAKNSHMDYIIIDSPGGMNKESERTSQVSDIFITPVSDSRLDLDVIGQPSDQDKKFIPGCYANMIWEARKHKLINEQQQLHWIVVPNKLNTRITNNQKQIMNLLNTMKSSLRFEMCPGVKDRVIFKELFNVGRTVFDLKKSELTISRISAKNEIRSILNKVINLDS